MRIDGTTGSQTSLGFNPTNANRVGAPESAGSDSSFASVQFQPTSDFLPLLSALGRLPQVRQDVIGDASTRLSTGELGTPEARQQTVESILGASPAVPEDRKTLDRVRTKAPIALRLANELIDGLKAPHTVKK